MASVMASATRGIATKVMKPSVSRIGVSAMQTRS